LVEAPLFLAAVLSQARPSRKSCREETRVLRLLLHWIVNAIALLIVSKIVPGFQVATIGAALIAVVVIGLLNATLGLLLKIITLPLGILTLGLFFLVINALILKLSSGLVPGFYVRTFAAALIGAIVLALLQMLFSLFAGDSAKA
jgi:putative membrane protein